MKYNRVKGTYDHLPDAREEWKASEKWQYVENVIRELAAIYSYSEVRTPMLESTDLFARGVGEATDIVSKEMYTFEDKASRSLTLRPECTASVVRSYIENGLHHAKTSRYFYLGPCFRYDRAQKGRYRQFYQFGVEHFGLSDPAADVDTIDLLTTLFNRLGIKRLVLLINCIGDVTARNEYSKALRSFLLPKEDQLSKESQQRLNINAFRILDSKNPIDQQLLEGAPSLEEFLSPKSRDHFAKVKQGLDELGIDYKIDSRLARGLDYYNDTVFEVVASDDLGAQNTIGAGGRYDSLVEMLGGQSTPAVGFAVGLERMIQTMISQGVSFPDKIGPEVFFLPLDEESKIKALAYTKQLRAADIACEVYLKNYNLRKGLALAETCQAKRVVVLGETELKNNCVTIKMMQTREEKSVSLSQLIDTLKEMSNPF